jgi:anti-sigma factor RsiW
MTDQPRLPEEMLSAYVDGEVTDAEREVIEARIERDDTWRHIVAEVIVARDAVRGLPEREAPAGFWLRVLTRVAETADDEAAIAASADVVSLARATPRRIPRWGALAAAAIAVVVGVAVAAPQRNDEVAPSLTDVADQHAAATSTQSDPVTNLAPAAVPVQFGP